MIIWRGAEEFNDVFVKNPCLDSSVFIGGFNDEVKNFVKRGELFRHIIMRGRNSEIKLHMATAAIAEVYRSKSLGVISDAKYLDEFMQLIDEDLISPIELDRNTAIQAHALCRTYVKLRPFDAIHIACALTARCDYLLTWDKGMLGVKHDKIEIVKPFIEHPDLFSSTCVATAEEQYAWNCANAKRADPIDAMFIAGEGI